MRLSDKITKYRKLNGWSQEDLACKLNVDLNELQYTVSDAYEELKRVLGYEE